MPRTLKPDVALEILPPSSCGRYGGRYSMNRRHRVELFCLVVAFGSVTISPCFAAEGSGSAEVEETRVGPFPAQFANMMTSLSGTILTTDGKAKGANRLIHPVLGPGPEITGLDNNTVAFSSDGLRVAYPGRMAGDEVLILDQQPIREHVPAAAKPYFSPDGSRLAFIAKKHGKEYVVVNGQPGREYDAIGRFSCLCFDESGKRLAYVARQSGKWFVVLDDEPGKGYQDIFSPGPQFDPSGTHLAYFAKQSGKTVPVIDRVEGTPVDGVLTSSPPRFSSSGGRFAFPALFGKRARMVVDGQPGPEYDMVAAPTFGRDGKHFAYFARRDGKWHPIIDGREGPGLDGITAQGVVLSADGARHAYAATAGGQWRVVVDGTEGPLHFGVHSLTPQFSEDGTRVAYVAMGADTSYTSMLDGVETGAKIVDLVPSALVPFFSGNDWHLAYPTKDLRRVVLDGHRGPGYDRVLLPILDSSAGISYFAVRADTLYRVKQRF